MINIAGTTAVDDPSYRYKMPRIVPKVEGRGNGIKTVLVNVSDIATALNRDASEITKFFGCELGAQTTMSVEDDRFIVNGAHSTGDLQNFMHRYIESFVLCKNCRLPETHYKIKSGIICQKCMACGSKDPCDMTHKLTTFILKQHKKAKETKDKESKKDKKKDKKSKSKDEGDVKDEGESSPAKVKKEKKPKKKSKSKDDVAEVDADDVEVDTESEATDAAIEQFKLWLNNNSPSNSSSVVLPKQQHLAAIVEELRSIQTLSSLRPSDRAIIYIGATFTSSSIPDNDVEKHKDVLTLLAPKSSEIQQRQLIAAAEWFCGTRYPDLLRMFPVMLKQLYDEDIVEEETFYAWHTDITRNEYSAEQSMISLETLEHLKEAAKLFIVWLQEADEEGDSDEDESAEDDDDEDA
eukprot:CAMPEP_0185025720 /NCGR_PEP_ID=MMETSP1103-20130426/8953_1 /TAXON_ID=36769 /ORGANISM="Paraphysomonas bandaiensis, Strain Caron Lab Isolate" /LENGTH=407 /DNA_ID=CAMNT_0027559009 /DNA_START=179 /DNA_END=1402 /DNA_ORIENTATION=-